jgi:lipid-binding SYLF domain-containing protein
MHYRALTIAIVAALPMVATVGCSTAPSTRADQRELDTSAVQAVNQATAADPSLRGVLNRSAGYAVFPSAGSGGLIIGGGYGKGALFEQGHITGYCDMTLVSAGATIGGQKYSEIIAFQTPNEVAKFKNGDFKLSADASAVAINAGAAANAQFKNNIIVFVYSQEGLMADASLGAQTFRFTPLGAAQQAAGQVGPSYDNQGQQINTNTSSGSNINNPDQTTINP